LNVLSSFSVPRASLAQQRSAVAMLDTMATESKRLETVYRLKLAHPAKLKQSILHRAFPAKLTLHPENALPEAAA